MTVRRFLRTPLVMSAMITINLIPEGRRAVEGTPLSRFLTILGGVVGFCIEGVVLAYFLMGYRPAQDTLDELKATVQKYGETIKQIETYDVEIKGFKDLRGQVEELYTYRRKWGPILSRLREPDLLPANVWYNKMELKSAKGTGRGRAQEIDMLTISAFARGSEEKNPAPMHQAATEFVNNLKIDRKDFSEAFEGQLIFTGGTTTQLQGLKEVEDAPREAVAFAVKLKVKAKTARRETP